MLKETDLDHHFMGLAIKEAHKAFKASEVPVGAVIVHDGRVVSRGYNRTEAKKDPTVHAEMVALRAAAKKLNAWRLTGATLYVTLEPCAMCMGASILARIDRIVFGPRDPKGGAAGSVFDLSQEKRLNHRIETMQGVREAECADLLRSFFKALRRTKEK